MCGSSAYISLTLPSAMDDHRLVPSGWSLKARADGGLVLSVGKNQHPVATPVHTGCSAKVEALRLVELDAAEQALVTQGLEARASSSQRSDLKSERSTELVALRKEVQVLLQQAASMENERERYRSTVTALHEKEAFVSREIQRVRTEHHLAMERAEVEAKFLREQIEHTSSTKNSTAHHESKQQYAFQLAAKTQEARKLAHRLAEHERLHVAEVTTLQAQVQKLKEHLAALHQERTRHQDLVDVLRGREVELRSEIGDLRERMAEAESKAQQELERARAAHRQEADKSGELVEEVSRLQLVNEQQQRMHALAVSHTMSELEHQKSIFNIQNESLLRLEEKLAQKEAEEDELSQRLSEREQQLFAEQTRAQMLDETNRQQQTTLSKLCAELGGLQQQVMQMDELADLSAAAGLSDHFGVWHQSAEKSLAQIGTRAVATYLSSNGKDISSRPECAPALPAALKQQLSLESEGMALAQTDNEKSHDRPRPKSGLLEELRRALEEVRFPVLSAAHYCVCSKASHLCCALWHSIGWVPL